MAPAAKPAQAGSTSFWSRLHAVYMNIRFVLHFVLLTLNRIMFGKNTWRRKANKRDILVIGDEHASGFGDWLIFGQEPGYGKYLDQELRADKDVKFVWSVFANGHLGSRSDDWLPRNASKPRRFGWSVFTSLFEDAFGPSNMHSGCDMVIIHLGWHDEHEDPQKTADNIVEIGRELVKRGKRVWVCGMPIRGFTDDVRKGWMLAERNSAIKEAIKQAKIEHLRMGAEPEHFRRPELFSWDGKHLSRKGYLRLASEMCKLVKLHCIQIEWLKLEPLVAAKVAERDRVFHEKTEQARDLIMKREMAAMEAAQSAQSGAAEKRRD
eukprot:TRINITY_DN20619_c1_g1_i1.p1 TRINITY_DN20619_c1_g1~~TRINITY_DN20619_c1_g1_i1.p1  ORF type:complete len:322 (+),score=88.54 TRINITY_DN20619_c1_g1_i1:90-1055(+)